jgi:methionine synthase I (cobalamin-dependent)
MRYNRVSAMRFLEALAARSWLAEGGMGTRLLAKGVPPGECLEALNLSNPPLVREIHEEYRASGADILKSNTFGANRARLARHGLEEKCRELNMAGVEIARQVAGDEGFVAGAVGPTGVESGLEPRRAFEPQIRALTEAGADFILLETFRNLSELGAAIETAREVSDLPVVAQVSPDSQGRLEGDLPPEEYVPKLVEWSADAIGCNCGAGLAAMVETLRRMAQLTDKPLTAQPSAGLPFIHKGLTVYPCLPDEMAEAAERFLRLGVRVIGGCCGTDPARIGAMRKMLDVKETGSLSSPVL